jgi:hypothetical protein
MEEICSYEMLLSTYKDMLCYNPEDQHNIFTTVRISNLCKYVAYKMHIVHFCLFLEERKVLV